MPADYDDRDDDRRDDREDEYDDGDRPRRGDYVIEDAKAATRGPGIAFIVLGAISLLLTAWSAVTMFGGGLEAQFAAERAKIDNNPAMPADQKQAMKEFMQTYEKVVTVAGPFTTVLSGLTAVLTFLAGRGLMNLKGRGLVYTASILNFLPCVSGCCLLGIPFGIWAIVVLGKPEVKDGYAAVARGAADYDR